MDRRRIAVLVAALVAIAVVVTALLVAGGGDEPDRADGSPSADIGDCLGSTLATDGDACVALRAALDEQDPDGTDVLVLVPPGAPTDDVTALVESAASMWSEGRPMPAGQEAPDLRVSTETLGDDAAVHPLLDPEIVFVAASAVEPSVETSFEFYDVDGTRCTEVDDGFALDSWTGLPSFNSHHSLPEGTFDYECNGDPVCVAVNATLSDPRAAGGPFEAFGLVGDEMSHCLDGRGRRP